MVATLFEMLCPTICWQKCHDDICYALDCPIAKCAIGRFRLATHSRWEYAFMDRRIELYDNYTHIYGNIEICQNKIKY